MGQAITQRRNQATLTPAEWTAFINAINALFDITRPAPLYRDFVRVHVAAMSPTGMAWGVHSMPWMGMNGPNFLAWHRHYLLLLEQRLQRENPTVSVPYWDWINQPNLPQPINTPTLLNRWGVTRQWNPNLLPAQADIDAVNARTDFPSFQRRLENVHGGGHNAVGGTMMSSSSPADPIFWLHHANVDRIWAQWQQSHPGENPPNGNEILRPSQGFRVRFGVRVSSRLNITALNYSYV